MVNGRRVNNLFTITAGVFIIMLGNIPSIKLQADSIRTEVVKTPIINQKTKVAADTLNESMKAKETKLDSVEKHAQLEVEAVANKVNDEMSNVTININSASAIELQEMSGIGQEKASEIIEYRQQHGNFQTVDDLQNVPGIGKRTIDKNRHWLAVE